MFACRTQRENFSLYEIMDKIKLERFSFLRNSSYWELGKKRLFISSFLEGFPLASITVLSDVNGTIHVTEGYNRLLTLIEYLNNEFDVKGFLYKDLAGIQRSYYEDTRIHFNLLKPASGVRELYIEHLIMLDESFCVDNFKNINF